MPSALVESQCPLVDTLASEVELEYSAGCLNDKVNGCISYPHTKKPTIPIFSALFKIVESKKKSLLIC